MFNKASLGTTPNTDGSHPSPSPLLLKVLAEKPSRAALAFRYLADGVWDLAKRLYEADTQTDARDVRARAGAP